MLKKLCNAYKTQIDHASIIFAVKEKIDNKNGLDTADFIKPKNYLLMTQQ